MSTGWGINDLSKFRIVAAAGAVIDRKFGIFFTPNLEEIQAHSQQDRHALWKFMAQQSGLQSQDRIEQEFEVGYIEARKLLYKRGNRALVDRISRWLCERYLAGVKLIDGSEVEEFVNELLGTRNAPHSKTSRRADKGG